MKVWVVGALALGIAAASASAAGAQVSATEATEDVLRGAGLDPSRFVLEEQPMFQDDGWEVTAVEASDAGGAPGQVAAVFVRNTGDTPTCFRFKWKVYGPVSVSAAKNYNFVVEPRTTQGVMVFQTQGAAGDYNIGLRTWPARTDVSEQRCSSVQPADLNAWLAE
ncbi:hypothetical protein [Caulobacter sp. 17J80-11]|uniref:hypothetical protein n=1 Tax=Caulobacter sp. 17J80-11 TaxID=2763502 RepID=UPI001653C65A|nr:hypothetical protein [Caulobacter sp. 17J80-11]MBC6981391.1 hypothetical protein [Caulobacter sp. 17J80-11]